MFSFRKKNGQSTLEYLLIWAAIVSAVIYSTIGRGTSSVIQQSVRNMLSDAGDLMEDALDEPVE